MQPLRAQASSEFLVILAAVLGIAAITAALILQFTESNIDVRYRQSKVFWLNEKPIAIEDAKAYHNGLTLLVKNSGSRRILLESVSAQDEFVPSPNTRDYPDPITLEPGMRYRFDIPVTYSDTTNRRFVSLEMKFSYETEAGKQEIGKERLILPVPGACNVNGELCSENSDCCNNVPCRFGTCGGCAPQGESCLTNLDCCGDMQCHRVLDVYNEGFEISRTCQPRSDLVPILLNSTSDPESPYIGSVRIANIGPGPAAGSVTLLAWGNATCPLPCETVNGALMEPIGSGNYSDRNVYFGNFSYGPGILCRNIASVAVEADNGNSLLETNELNNNLEFQPDCTACRGTNSYCSAALINETCCAGLSCETPGIPGARCCVSSGSECSSPADCCGGLTCSSGICATPGGPNDPCNSNLDCAEGLVCGPGDVCSICISIGNTCGQGTPCCGDSFCSEIDDNTCAPCSQPGEICSPLQPCCSGPCTNGRCGITELPDLITFGDYGDRAATVDVPITITVGTRNAGLGDAPLGSVTLVESLSVGLTFDSSPSVSQSVPALAAGDEMPPAGISVLCLEAGPMAYRITADSTDAVGEGAAGEANNELAYAVQCNALPDYVAFADPAPPAAIYFGQSFQMNIRTENTGAGGAAASSITRIDEIAGGGGMAFDGASSFDAAVPALAPGGTDDDLIGNVVCTEPGQITIRVRADANDDIPGELSEANNEMRYSIECLSRPDLASLIPSPPALTQTVGVPFGIVMRTNNIGSLSGGAGSVTRASSPTGGLTFDTNPAYDHPISSNIAPSSGTDSPSISVLCTSAGNDREILVEADAPSPGVVPESNELNNANTYLVDCTQPALPDLVASIPSPPASIGASPVNVVVRTSNQGGADATASVTRITAETGLTFNGNSFVNIGVTSLPSTDPDTFSDSSPISVACTNHDGNTYYIYVQADTTNTNSEGAAGEANNQVQYAVICDLALPDLVADARDSDGFPPPPMSIPTGSYDFISVRTTNAGVLASGASTTTISASAGARFVSAAYGSGSSLSIPVPSRNPGQYSSSGSFRVYCDTSGPKTISVTADSAYAVAEGAAGESNNFWSYTLQCT